MENVYNAMLGALEKSVVSILDADEGTDKRDLLTKSLGQFGEAFATTIVADIDQAYAAGAEEGYGAGAQDGFGKAAEDGLGLDLRKGFDHVAAFAAVLHGAQSFLQALEQDVGDDPSSHDALDAIDQWVQMGAEILHMMSGDHAAAGDPDDAQPGDDGQDDGPPPRQAAKADAEGDLAKDAAGEDQDRDGQDTPAEDPSAQDDGAQELAKAEIDLAKAELAKADAELAKRDKTIARLGSQIEGLAKALDDIKARPAPTAVIRTVAKDNESSLGKSEGVGTRAAELAKMAEALPDGDGKVLALTKAALAQPIAFKIG